MLSVTFLRVLVPAFIPLLCQVEHSQILEDLTHPHVTEEPEQVRRSLTIHLDPYEATAGTHAIVLCTEWDEFVVSPIAYLL